MGNRALEIEKVQSSMEEIAAIVNKHNKTYPENSRYKSGLFQLYAIDSAIEGTAEKDKTSSVSLFKGNEIKETATVNVVKPTAKNNKIIPQFKPSAIVKLDAEGNDISEGTTQQSVPETLYIDNSEVIKKYGILKNIEDFVRSKKLDLRFIELPILGYIGVEIYESNTLNPVISFSVDLTGKYITNDPKIILNNGPNDNIAIHIENMELLSQYLNKELVGKDISSLDMFSKKEKEVNKLIDLSTLRVKNSIDRLAMVDLFIKDSFQNVFTEALKEDPRASFRFYAYKNLKNFKLISEGAKKIIISYDAAKENGTVSMEISK